MEILLPGREVVVHGGQYGDLLAVQEEMAELPFLEIILR
ncbi:hypothetical protein AC87_4891 [Escherichia coli 3-105-05_S4_C1]|nr:hypothetical protein AC87_4891 [Escherichia coli 3-105-05_S4_C1]